MCKGGGRTGGEDTGENRAYRYRFLKLAPVWVHCRQMAAYRRSPSAPRSQMGVAKPTVVTGVGDENDDGHGGDPGGADNRQSPHNCQSPVSQSLLANDSPAAKPVVSGKVDGKERQRGGNPVRGGTYKFF